MSVLTQTNVRGDVLNPVANQSVALSSTYNSTYTESGAAKRVRVWFKTKGANSTAKLQGSFDATNWYDLQTLAAGVNTILDIAEPYLRVTVANANATAAEVNDVWLYAQV